jgi:hypothetical protein
MGWPESRLRNIEGSLDFDRSQQNGTSILAPIRQEFAKKRPNWNVAIEKLRMRSTAPELLSGKWLADRRTSISHWLVRWI